MTPAELTAARAELEAAIFSGQLRVRFSDGREIMYQSVSEMLKALKTLDTEIAVAASSNTGGTTSYATFSRDY